jgi:hypothetical protein
VFAKKWRILREALTMVCMTENIQIKGRLLSLIWPEEAAGATMAFDTSQLQIAKAEIEDESGVTHRVKVLVKWDADYLVGKNVAASSTAESTTLTEL